MAHHAHGAVRRRQFLAPLTGRSPEEAHRVSTPLELFFDLVIVVAVARAASGLHHAIVESHAGPGVLMYAMVFFGIWWAWVNFTWFASAYDNDDVVYRLLVLVQLTGALVFAAGIPNFEQGDLRVGVAGYVLMRLALVTLWLRAARADPERRRTALRYASGVTLVQVAWIGSLFLPPGFLRPVFWTLALVELLVPAWAEHAGRTPWHAEHIAERFGLFTLITLGESILAASLAVQAAAGHGAPARSLAPVLIGGLLIVFAFWWLYFEHPGHEVLTPGRAAFLWGYAHYFVLGAAAAVGAGLASAVDQAAGRAEISNTTAGAAVAIPAAVYLACLWFLHARSDHPFAARVATPGALVAVLLSPLTGQGVLAAGLVMGALTAFKVHTAAVAARA